MLEDGAFWGLEELQRLNLGHNRLKIITSGWLYGLNSLLALLVIFRLILSLYISSSCSINFC